MKKIVAIAVLMLSLSFLSGPVSAGDKLFKLDTCWMPSHESFVPWYAKKMGWDKEEGLDMEMHYFDSGMAELEALPARSWVLGGTGGVPMVYGNARYDAYMIGIGNNESYANVVFARPDNPALQIKGANPKFPEMFGSAETVKGKTFLVTTVSSVHYAMSLWLEGLGLKETDVIIKNMDQASIIAAFDSGIGDYAVLWAPYSYTAETKGWKAVSDIAKANAFLGLVLIGDKKFCDENPEIVAKFLRMYFRGINMLKQEGSSPEIVKLYQEFLREWGGMDLNDELAKKDIDAHPVYTLEEQLALFDNTAGESKSAAYQRMLAEFFAGLQKLTPAELEKVKSSGYVTDKYMKLIDSPIASYK